MMIDAETEGDIPIAVSMFKSILYNSTCIMKSRKEGKIRSILDSDKAIKWIIRWSAEQIFSHLLKIIWKEVLRGYVNKLILHLKNFTYDSAVLPEQTEFVDMKTIRTEWQDSTFSYLGFASIVFSKPKPLVPSGVLGPRFEILEKLSGFQLERPLKIYSTYKRRDW